MPNPLINDVISAFGGRYLDWKMGPNFQAFLTCKDHATAEQAMQDVNSILEQLRRDLRQVPPIASVAARRQMGNRFLNELLTRVRVSRHENTVWVHGGIKISVADMVKILMSEFPMN